MAKGKVVQVIGAVVDVEFPPGELPKILNAVHITGKSGDVEIDLIAEVMQHLGDSVTRCIAMSSTDGLVRGMEAEDTGSPITAWVVSLMFWAKRLIIIPNPSKIKSVGPFTDPHRLLKNKKLLHKFWKPELKLLT